MVYRSQNRDYARDQNRAPQLELEERRAIDRYVMAGGDELTRLDSRLETTSM